MNDGGKKDPLNTVDCWTNIHLLPPYFLLMFLPPILIRCSSLSSDSEENPSLIPEEILINLCILSPRNNFSSSSGYCQFWTRLLELLQPSCCQLDDETNPKSRAKGTAEKRHQDILWVNPDLPLNFMLCEIKFLCCLFWLSIAIKQLPQNGVA